MTVLCALVLGLGFGYLTHKALHTTDVRSRISDCFKRWMKK